MTMDPNMEQTPEQRIESEADRLLALATIPDLPAGAIERLMARIDTARAGNVVLVRPAAPRRTALFRYMAALPLAASLALGVYLGAQGTLDFALPAAVTGDVASIDDPAADFSGLGEAEQYVEENLS